MKYSKHLVIIAVSLFLVGCYSNTNSVLDNGGKSQLEARSYQRRSFETSDKNQTVRTVISTMQDLDFVVSKADENLGTVSGTKFLRNRKLQMTVIVRPRDKDNMIVRANAQYGLNPVEDPKAYQDFFSSLSKAMFLEAHDVG